MDFIPLSLSDTSKQTGPARPLPPSDYPLQLGMQWQTHTSRQFLYIGVISVFLHLIVFVVALRLPSLVQLRLPEKIIVEKRTPLYFPSELTQKAPNKNKPTKEIDLASLLAAQQDQQRQQGSPNPSVRHFEPPQNTGVPQPNKSPKITADAPNLALNQSPAELNSGALNGIAPTPPPPTNNPSPFQTAGNQIPPKIVPPHAPAPPPPGALNPGTSKDLQTQPAPSLPGLNGQLGNQHLGVELPSDLRGPDFKPYLERLLAIIRANWQRVTPEAARQGRIRGLSVVEFLINRDGSIARVRVAETSGANTLDLAAQTAVAMSTPLPRLPAEFTDRQVTVTLKFAYNMPVQ